MSEPYVDVGSEFSFGVFFTSWLRLSGCTHVLYFGLALEAAPSSKDLDSFDSTAFMHHDLGSWSCFLGAIPLDTCGKQ